MTKKSNNRRMLDTKLERQARDTFVFGILVCITLALIILVIRNKEPARIVSEQVAQSEQKLRELLSMEADFKSMREQAKQDSDAIDDFLQYCRSAEDIPDFQGEHVIHHGDSRLVFHVPKGKHQLEISVYRLSKSTKPKKDNSWIVSLRGDTGYLFEVISDREAKQLHWDLSANSPEFESRKETVLTGDFERAMGGVQIHESPMFYPNRAQRNEMSLRASVYGSDLITEWEKSAEAPPPMGLFGDRWRSESGNGVSTEIMIRVTLTSEGPTQVAATDAVDIIRLGRSDLLMPYSGGGKYELRTTK